MNRSPNESPVRLETVARAMAHPTRGEIYVAVADQPGLSAMELAERIKEPVGKVHYHLRILASDRLIGVSHGPERRGVRTRCYHPLREAVVDSGGAQVSSRQKALPGSGCAADPSSIPSVLPNAGDCHVSPSSGGPHGATNTRERLLRATLAVLAEDGITALSDERVATVAGVAIDSLVHHFPRQADLLRESLLLYVNEEVERLAAVEAALLERATSHEEVAFDIAVLIGRPSGGPLAELELYLQAARDPELREASIRCFAAYDSVATSALSALGVTDPGRYASAFVALVTGISVRRLGTDAADTDAVTSALLTLLRGALADA